jgi:RHS repeat-associated protein
VKATTDYEAFGKVVASTGTSENNRLFCTKERSASLGLDNFGFRYYDSELGRFIQRDPAGYPNGPNNYLYCSNNPANGIDPLGLIDISIFPKPKGFREKDEGVFKKGDPYWDYHNEENGTSNLYRVAIYRQVIYIISINKNGDDYETEERVH